MRTEPASGQALLLALGYDLRQESEAERENLAAKATLNQSLATLHSLSQTQRRNDMQKKGSWLMSCPKPKESKGTTGMNSREQAKKKPTGTDSKVLGDR